MKKLIATITAFVLVFSGLVYVQPVKTVEATEATTSVWDGTTVDTSWYTSNKDATEYTITTAAQLAGFASLVNSDSYYTFEEKTVKLGADIELNDVTNIASWGTTAPANKWTPIGVGKTSNATRYAFRGMFDGQGHTISGMYIESCTNTEHYTSGNHNERQCPVGLFGYIFKNTKTPSIKNVSVINSYIKNSSVSEVGMLVGRIVGNTNVSSAATIAIENVYVQGTIASTHSGADVGGICGEWMGQTKDKTNIAFKNIVSDVDILLSNLTSETYAGGILGQDESNAKINIQFENCVNLGDLEESTEKTILGGLCGEVSDYSVVSVTDCVNAGTLKAQYMGAAIGKVNVSTSNDGSLTATRFVNAGDITPVNRGFSTEAAGVIYGGKSEVSTATVTQCYSVLVTNLRGAASVEKEILTGSNALTTLTSTDFNATSWNMVAGIAPLPKQAAQMCGFVFQGASLTLDSSLQMNFKVKKDAVTDAAPSSVTFALNGDTKTVTTYTEDDEYYVYRCSEIAPYQIGEKVTATLHTTYDGTQIAGAMEYSVSEYCYKALETYTGTEHSKLQTLIVDLLNYGTESQKRAEAVDNYTVTSYANAALTDTQKEMASEDRTLTSVLNKGYETIASPSATWKTAGLNLTEKVVIRLQFETEDNITDWYVKFSDENQKSVNVTELIKATADNCYYVYLDDLNAYQMSDSVYATVYDAEDNAVSDTLQYSIESYACAQQSVETGNLGALVKAMMRYGDSAAAYQSK